MMPVRVHEWRGTVPPQRVLTVASNKGGVGKTTLAANLAVYLRALREDLPILVLSLDDQELIGRLFALEDSQLAPPDVGDALRRRDLAPALRLGQYGVHYVPPCPTLSDASTRLTGPFVLREMLAALDWPGLVVIDTKSDLGLLTQNALAASDLTLLAVADQTSLDQAERVYALLDGWGISRTQARVVLSLVDRRVKYREGEATDILALLLSEIRARGYPCFESFLSRSPKIESLYTNAARRPLSILHGAPGSLIHRQMAHLAGDVLSVLGVEGQKTGAEGHEAAPRVQNGERRGLPRRPFPRRIAVFAPDGPPILALSGRDLSAEGMAVEPIAALSGAGRFHVALPAEGGAEPLLVWARVLRREPDRLALRFELGEDPSLQRRVAHFVETLEPAA
jgi:cellulose biosynthesis protein BcsQ